MALGYEIRRLRKARGLTQFDLAIQIGVRESVISAWEHGRTPALGNIPALADALGVTPNDLLGYGDATTAEPALSTRACAVGE